MMAGTLSRIPAFQGEDDDDWSDQPWDVYVDVAIGASSSGG